MNISAVTTVVLAAGTIFAPVATPDFALAEAFITAPAIALIRVPIVTALVAAAPVLASVPPIRFVSPGRLGSRWFVVISV